MRLTYGIVALILCSCQPIEPDVSVAVSAESATGMGNSGSISLSSGNNNDLFVGYRVLRAETHSSGSTLTGIDDEGYDYGDVLYITNVGTGPLTLADDSGSSSSAHRFSLENDKPVVILTGEFFKLYRPSSSETQQWYAWKEMRRDVIATSTPSRSLGTAFCPSTARQTAAYYSVSVTSEISLSGGEDGRIELLVDAANPPTTVRGRVRAGNTGTVVLGVAQAMTIEGQLHYVIPAGHCGLLQSVTTTGSPAYSIVSQAEQAL